MGTHEELIRRNGKYAKMYETQAKYYQKEELDHACSVGKNNKNRDASFASASQIG